MSIEWILLNHTIFYQKILKIGIFDNFLQNISSEFLANYYNFGTTWPRMDLKYVLEWALNKFVQNPVHTNHVGVYE